MYSVNPCVGEGLEYVSIIPIAAEDVKVFVFEDLYVLECFSSSEIGVAGGPS